MQNKSNQIVQCLVQLSSILEERNKLVKNTKENRSKKTNRLNGIELKINRNKLKSNLEQFLIGSYFPESYSAIPN